MMHVVNGYNFDRFFGLFPCFCNSGLSRQLILIIIFPRNGIKNKKMTREGNLLTSNQFGTFGFLQSGSLDDEPLVLLDFGLEARKNENYDFNNADRDYSGYLFQYTLRGRGLFTWEGPAGTGRQTENLTAGTAFLTAFPENSRYFLPQDEPDNCWEYLYVHFQGPAALPFFSKIRASFGPCFALPADSLPILLLLNLHRELREGRQLKSYEGGELVYRFLSSLLRTLESPSLFEPSAPVAESIRYMKEHFDRRFSMEELAGRLGLSAAYFTRLFTRETGQTPLVCLNGIRLSHAVFLLLNTSLSIEEIALSCGFSCGNYFCKVFRKASGFSPAEYRKRYARQGRPQTMASPAL